ncbi:MAG: LexA family transcriptional regulator [Mesorhizobium sp.]
MDNISILKALLLTMKQAALAKELGVEQASISRWLKGTTLKAENEKRLHEFAAERGLLAESNGRPKPDRRTDQIDEIDVTGGLGGGGISIVETTAENGISFHTEAVRDFWRLPDWMLNRFNARPQHIKAFPTKGDSMSPTIFDGDVVFADTRHRVPSPPGIYVLADEFGGVVVKRLEVVSRPSDDIVTVRITSDNPHHKERELTLDEIHIIGRFVGRFTVQ